MTRRSPVSIGAIRPETGAHSDVRASKVQTERLFAVSSRIPVCTPSPDVYTPVSHAAAAVSHRSAITDQDHRLRSSRSRHARGRAAARAAARAARGSRGASTLSVRAAAISAASLRAPIHFIYGNGSGFWKLDRCASRAARAFPGRDALCVHTHDVDLLGRDARRAAPEARPHTRGPRSRPVSPHTRDTVAPSPVTREPPCMSVSRRSRALAASSSGECKV